MKEINCFLSFEEVIDMIVFGHCSQFETPTVFCIAGQSCSGKTTLARALAEHSKNVSLLKMDDWFRDIDEQGMPLAENGAVSFDWPQSYRWREMQKAIVSLANGREIIYPSYDLASNKRRPENDWIMRPGSLIVVEGLYSILFCADLAVRRINIWTHAPFFARLQRRLQRDRIYGMQELEIIARFLHAENCFDRFGRAQAKKLDLIACSAW